MINSFFFWIKTRDNLYSFFCLKKLLRFVLFNPIWKIKIFRGVVNYMRSWMIVNYHIINKDPLIIVDVLQHRSFRSLDDFLPHPQKAHYVCLNWWHLESEADIKIIKQQYENYKKQFPENEILYLCNSMTQYTLFRNSSLPSMLCNQNAFLDEHMHTIESDSHKEYDAIYLAVAVPCKRHYLAKEIDRLALITYYAHFSKQNYIDDIKTALPHATWIIRPNPLKGYIAREKIHLYLNKAKVGLCLSAAEGAMYASVEYLLCGLPIVTTRSIGGRDVFFDDEYVMVVNDTPAAVKAGVDAMIKKNIPGSYIREKTIKKMKGHRKRFLSWLTGISPQSRKYSNEHVWQNIFTNKMLMSRRIRYIQNDIQHAGNQGENLCIK